MQEDFCISVGLLHFMGKKVTENGNSDCAGACKVGKMIRFWPKFYLHSPNIQAAWKDKKYWKNVCCIAFIHQTEIIIKIAINMTWL